MRPLMNQAGGLPSIQEPGCALMCRTHVLSHSSLPRHTSLAYTRVYAHTRARQGRRVVVWVQDGRRAAGPAECERRERRRQARGQVVAAVTANTEGREVQDSAGVTSESLQLQPLWVIPTAAVGLHEDDGRQGIKQPIR